MNHNVKYNLTCNA